MCVFFFFFLRCAFSLCGANLVATFRVARSTLNSRKLCLVGCRDRPWRALPLTCPNVKNLKEKQKMKRNESKKKCKETQVKKKKVKN